MPVDEAASPRGAPADGPGEPDPALIAERLDDIARLVSDWIWETDAELVLTYVSPRVVEVLGFHPRQLIGKRFLELGRFELAPDEAPPLDAARRSPFRDLRFAMAD